MSTYISKLYALFQGQHFKNQSRQQAKNSSKKDEGSVEDEFVIYGLSRWY